jgi:ABC-2 type transport system permease protein
VATSLSVVRERERGSMEQLMVSPLHPFELIVGKLVPYALVSVGATALVLGASVLLFAVPVRGSIALLAVCTLVFLLGALGMGLLISTLVRTQELAFLVAVFATMLPTFVLSGFVFPISNMPAIIQAVTYAVPARYFLVVLRGIMLKGVGLETFANQLLLLAGFAVLMLTLGTLRLKRIMG